MSDVCSDKDFVLAELAHDGSALQWADREVRADREAVMTAVSNNGDALEHASAALRSDREVVLAAVAQNGYALEHASVSLRADREVVLAAVTQGASGWALVYASTELRADREVVLAAVAQNGYALAYASDALRADPFLRRLSRIPQRGRRLWLVAGSKVVFANGFWRMVEVAAKLKEERWRRDPSSSLAEAMRPNVPLPPPRLNLTNPVSLNRSKRPRL